MLSIFDSNKQKTPLEISVVLSRWGRCTVVNSAPIVKKSWNQEKYTLPWPWFQPLVLATSEPSFQSKTLAFKK
jgi:hypothetical protein